ncbi:sulfotransferase family protein [Winogradskyella sp. J14-2]|uniref:sulfotransferase-like domain-containing protein n=1 Tax=Winogradskyella sp. J14-2 TaxID=1936080 RepID=UPI000972E495|nr:sulfotransferase family protein [Winogradskyella sp. J14-2]APY07491.1 sulfotransferase family protein [Winogradskyella sp. J14-2]
MDNIKRICLWSGPRNISTALMYAFAQRTDTKVFDEPLYAYYLRHHPYAKGYHPGAEDIIKTMESNGEKVVEVMLRNTEKPVLFFKQMTHHLLDLERSFMKDTINIILTRDPLDMLPSFDKVIHNFTIDDVGYQLHIDLLNYFESQSIPFKVINSKQVLKNPEDTLSKLCEFADIPFKKSMLSWKPQKREEDGIWAKYWYHNIHKSSGFQEYKPKTEAFPAHLNTLLEQCLPHYNRLMEYAI